MSFNICVAFLAAVELLSKLLFALFSLLFWQQRFLKEGKQSPSKDQMKQQEDLIKHYNKKIEDLKKELQEERKAKDEALTRYRSSNVFCLSYPKLTLYQTTTGLYISAVQVF